MNILLMQGPTGNPGNRGFVGPRGSRVRVVLLVPSCFTLKNIDGPRVLTVKMANLVHLVLRDLRLVIVNTIS